MIKKHILLPVKYFGFIIVTKLLPLNFYNGFINGLKKMDSKKLLYTFKQFTYLPGHLFIGFLYRRETLQLKFSYYIKLPED